MTNSASTRAWRRSVVDSTTSPPPSSSLPRRAKVVMSPSAASSTSTRVTVDPRRVSAAAKRPASVSTAKLALPAPMSTIFVCGIGRFSLGSRPDQVPAVVELVGLGRAGPVADVALVELGVVRDALAIEVDADPGTGRNVELASVPRHQAALDDVVLEVPVVGLVVEDEVAVRGVDLQHRGGGDAELAPGVRDDRQPGGLGHQ